MTNMVGGAIIDIYKVTFGGRDENIVDDYDRFDAVFVR